MKTTPTEIVRALRETRLARTGIDGLIQKDIRIENFFRARNKIDDAIECLRIALESSVLEQAAKEYEERE